VISALRSSFAPWWTSFRLRSVVACFAVLLLVWVGWNGWRYVDAGRVNSQWFDTEIKLAAELIISVLPRTVTSQGPTGRFRLAEQPYRREGEASFQVWSRDRRLIIRYGNAPTEPMNPTFASGFSDATIDGRLWRVYALSDADGEIQVQIGDHVAQRRNLAVTEAGNDLRILGVLMIPMALGLLLVGWWGARPLQRLQEAIHAREPDDVRSLPVAGLPQEAMPLVNAFNALLERAAHARQAQKRFVADAAHELRTPMAALRVQAQVALRSSDAGQRDEALRDVIEGIDRNTRVAEQLLDMARVDGRELRAAAPAELVDVAAIVQDAIRLTQSLAARRGVTIRADVPMLRVQSEQGMLSAVIRNLLDNAVRYTRPDTIVTVHGTANLERRELWIDDQGPGLSAAQIEQALQPFARLDSSGESGSGLGLSIVVRACALLNHRLVLERRVGHEGLRATVGFGSLEVVRKS
jgi:signal transduction histidine kinase